MNPPKSRLTEPSAQGARVGLTSSKREGAASKLSASFWLTFSVIAALLGACHHDDPAPGDRAPGLGVYIKATWQANRATVGHQVHVVQERVPCGKCHEVTGDSIGKVVPERCASCHEKEAKIQHDSVHAGQRFTAETKADCTSCHAFTPLTPEQGGGPDTPEPKPTECNRCHSQRQTGSADVRVHSDQECVKCHRPHEDEKPKSAPCADCHKDLKNSHAGHGKTPTESCTGCHQKQHATAASALPTCVECHSKESPVIPASALFAGGHAECIGCHRPHEFQKAQAVACNSCHKDVNLLGGGHIAPHNVCTNCHTPHDVRGSANNACTGCHKDVHPNHPKHGIAGTCVGCHTPHPATSAAHSPARKCSSCHQTAANEKSFHNGTECKQCHKPHEFVKAATDRDACNSCHARQLTQIKSNQGHQKCEGCHSGLPHRPTALGVGCASCHARENNEANKGHSKCVGCHEPHSGSKQAACGSCHKPEQSTAPAGHQECKNCHSPHSGKQTNSGCESCHANQAKTHHGHVSTGCATCHRAHGPSGVASPPSCTSCHAQANLPGLHQKDKHTDCRRCHSGHGEAAPSADRTRCDGCHANKTNHFPDAPRCTNCHLFNHSK